MRQQDAKNRQTSHTIEFRLMVTVVWYLPSRFAQNVIRPHTRSTLPTKSRFGKTQSNSIGSIEMWLPRNFVHTILRNKRTHSDSDLVRAQMPSFNRQSAPLLHYDRDR
jgi:hypothetical protein